MTGVSYEADAHLATRLADGRIIQVRRGDRLPEDIDTAIAEAFTTAGLATRFEEI